MKCTRFTEEQIIKVLKQAEGGASENEICRLRGITQQNFYRWKLKFGGIALNDAKKIKSARA